MAFDTGHALVIGVGTYANAPHLNVPLTAEDAEQVAAVLRDPRYCGYPQAQVRLLREGAATRAGILAALDDLVARTGADDTVMIFYSGHGEYGEDGYYLTTHDTAVLNRKVAPGTGVRERELLERLNKLKARRAILIFNACHSGALSPGTLGEQGPGASLPDQLTAALLGTGEGRIVITACREDQRSYFVQDDPATLFTQALIDALLGRRVDSRRGYISAFDLYEHVFTSVSSEVKRRWELTQEPELTIHKGIGALAVALHRGRQPEGMLGAQDRPEALDGAVRELDPAESNGALNQILSGRLNLAAGRDIRGNTIVGRDQTSIKGDQINAQGSQGFINRPAGPVSQTFGTSRTINTGGGDYAEGSIDKRHGVFVSGGTVHGPVVGSNQGTITYNAGSAPGPGSALGPALEDARRHVSLLIQQVQQNDEGLAGELQRVELDLSGAIRARDKGNAAERQRLLERAKDDLANLARQHALVRPLVDLLQQVQ